MINNGPFRAILGEVSRVIVATYFAIMLRMAFRAAMDLAHND